MNLPQAKYDIDDHVIIHIKADWDKIWWCPNCGYTKAERAGHCEANLECLKRGTFGGPSVMESFGTPVIPAWDHFCQVMLRPGCIVTSGIHDGKILGVYVRERDNKYTFNINGVEEIPANIDSFSIPFALHAPYPLYVVRDRKPEEHKRYEMRTHTTDYNVASHYWVETYKGCGDGALHWTSGRGGYLEIKPTDIYTQV